GSPPPAGSKKVVPKLRSVSSMVMPPASTGNDSSSRKAVISTDQANSGILCSVMPGARMLKMVVMKLMAPRIEEAPAIWIDRIARSMAGPGWRDVANGGYMVQPPPMPKAPGALGTKAESSSRMSAGGSSQKEM